jgi:hypothetical protein
MNHKIISKIVSNILSVQTFRGTNSIYNNQFTSIESKSMDARRYPFFVSLSFVFSFMFLISGGVWGQFSFSDNATNYGGTWANSSNNGTGFNAWDISTSGGNAGTFIGNPSSNGMGTAGIGTTAFG